MLAPCLRESCANASRRHACAAVVCARIGARGCYSTPNSTVARMSTLNSFGQVPIGQHTCVGVVLPPAALDFPTNAQICLLDGATAVIGARSVAASYTPPMLVTRVRLPACACVRRTRTVSPIGRVPRARGVPGSHARPRARTLPTRSPASTRPAPTMTVRRALRHAVACGGGGAGGERGRGGAVFPFSGVGRANADYLIPLPQYRRCICANSACACCRLCCGELVQPSTASARRRWASPHARAAG